MHGWEFQEIGKPLVRVEKEDPTPGPGQVVVDVRAGGICHSDVAIIDGQLAPLLAHIPMILGHEVAGVISEVGPDVTDWAVGDKVAIIGKGVDAPGLSQDGGFGTKVIGPVYQLLRVPDGIPFDQAAAATDAGQTSRKGLRLAGVGEGTRVGIIGLGGLGLTAARMAVLLGAEVHGVEVNEKVWDKARQLGVTSVVKDASELADLGLDAFVDYAGFGTTTAAAIDAVKPEGVVVQVGMGRLDMTISTQSLIMKDVTLRGSNAGSMEDAEDVIRMIGDGGLHIETEIISPDDIPEGLERLRRGEVVGRLVASFE